MNNYIKIGDLFGNDIIKNIVGINNPKQRNNVDDAKIELNASKTKPKCNYPIKAIYPMLNEDCFKITMDNYRKHIYDYNAKVLELNQEVNKHNALVDDFTQSNELTEVQKQFRRVFLLKFGKYKRTLVTDQDGNDHIKEIYTFNEYTDQSIRLFNEQVEEFCKLRGNILHKRNYQMVKPIAERIFWQILFSYNVQLHKRNTFNMNLGVAVAGTLEQVDILPSKIIAKCNETGIKILDLSTRTIKRHIERLIEAGVLINYEFKGSNRPSKTHINSHILAVYDLKTSKFIISENQSLNSMKLTNRHHSKEITRTFKNKLKISESEQVDIQGKGVAHSSQQASSFDFYRNTTKQDAKDTQRGGGENVKVPKTLSEKLRDLIIHPSELAQLLSEGIYNNYTPIDIRALHNEAFRGQLTRDEFRELLIQDFFKTAAKLYRSKNVYVGSWLNAIHAYMNKKLLAFTGDAFNKNVALEYVIEWRWRLEYARKWFVKHPDFRILFPSDYFDVNRTTNKEVGFEYTKKAYKNSQKSIEKAEARRKKLAFEADKRQTKNTKARLVENKVNQFIKGKITLTDLYEYVNNNHKEFLPSLHQYISIKTTTNKC